MHYLGIQISVCLKTIFLISQPKHMLWEFKRTVSLRLRSNEACNALPRHPDKCVFENYFSYFSTKTYLVGTQKSLLIRHFSVVLYITTRQFGLPLDP